MIVCILSVPATLSSFLLPFSLQKMQHLSILQLYLQQKTTEDAYFAENIGMNFTEMLNLILYPSKHWDSHQNYFDTMYYRYIDENKMFSNGGLNFHIARIAQRCQSTLQRYRNSKKNFVWTVLQGSPKMWGLATGLYILACSLLPQIKTKPTKYCFCSALFARKK